MDYVSYVMYNLFMPRKTLTFLGIILVLVELGGLPNQWKTVYGAMVGIILIIIALVKKGDSAYTDDDSSFKRVMTDEQSQSHENEERKKVRD